MFQRNKFTVILFHFLVWAFLFAMPYVLSIGSEFLTFNRYIRFTVIPLFLYGIVFYCNYLFLIDKYFFPKKYFYFFGLNLLLFAFLIWLKQDILIELLTDPDVQRSSQRRQGPKKVYIYFDFLFLILPLIFSIALKMGSKWIKSEAEKKEMVNAQLQSEIIHLKYQLQPHFFFNSLNNIYSLVDLSPEQAKETIHALSKLMRYLLYDSNTEKVDLNKEIEFIEKYIELMRLRTSGNVEIDNQIAKVSDSIAISPLLFISLIENAFKHGVSATEKSPIQFQLQVEKGAIHFHSENRDFAKSHSDKSGSGIGLENLRKRLDLLYPGKHRLEINSENGVFSTDLYIDTN